MGQAHCRTYSEETRRRAVELIRLGAGKKLIASLLAIPVYTARDRIRLHGSEEDGAPVAGGGYDWQTRVDAARDHVEGGLTLAAVMKKYRIGSDRTLKHWCRLYRMGGPQALIPRRGGRPRGSRNHEPARVRRLEEENEYLRARAAYPG